MKKTIIIMLLVLAIAAPSYALNIIDKMLYKEVVLRNNNGVSILVNRLTGSVEYVMSGVQYMPIPKELKKQFQTVYDAQEQPLRK